MKFDNEMLLINFNLFGKHTCWLIAVLYSKGFIMFNRQPYDDILKCGT